MNIRNGLLSRYSHINWAFTDQALVSGGNLLTSVLLARYLGPDEFGKFVLLWIMVEYAQGFQGAIVLAPMMSIGPKHSRDERTKYFSAVLAQQLPMAFLSFLLLLVGAFVVGVIAPEWQLEGLAVPLGFAAFAYQFQFFFRRYFYARENPSMAFATDMVRFGVQIPVLIWLLLAIDVDAVVALWIIAAAAFIAALFGFCVFGTFEWSKEVFWAVVQRHWRFSRWLVASSIIRWGTSDVFLMVTGALLGTSAVGGMRAAVTLVAVTHLLLFGLENIAYPRAARHLSESGQNGLVAYLRRLALFGGAPMAIMLAIVAVAPEMWLNLVYGEEYTGQGFVIQWWAFIYVLFFIGIPFKVGLCAIEHTRPFFFAMLSSALVGLLAAYPMIHAFGVPGAMAGIALTQSIYLLGLAYGFLRMLRELQ